MLLHDIEDRDGCIGFTVTRIAYVVTLRRIGVFLTWVESVGAVINIATYSIFINVIVQVKCKIIGVSPRK
jgi:hypothetical protein